jgi:hypothetical protein
MFGYTTEVRRTLKECIGREANWTGALTCQVEEEGDVQEPQDHSSIHLPPPPEHHATATAHWLQPLDGVVSDSGGYGSASSD